MKFSDTLMARLQAAHVLNEQIFCVQDQRVLYTRADQTAWTVQVIVSCPTQHHLDLATLTRYAQERLPEEMTVAMITPLGSIEFSILIEVESGPLVVRQ